MVSKREDDSIIVTCIALRPNLDQLRQEAWELAKKENEEHGELIAIVDRVLTDGIEVNVYGLDVFIPLDRLSAEKSKSISRFFCVNQELHLNLIEFDEKEQQIVLSNVGTSTDPKNLVSELENRFEAVDAQITNIAISNDLEVGLRLNVLTDSGNTIQGFAPRRYVEASRFVPLSDSFTIGGSLRVNIKEVDLKNGRLICGAEDFEDPWSQAGKYHPGDHVEVIVREVTDLYANCEIEPGIEGQLFHRELAWADNGDTRQLIRELAVGEILNAVITKIDTEHKHISISKRRLVRSKTGQFYDDNQGQIVPCSMVEDCGGFAVCR